MSYKYYEEISPSFECRAGKFTAEELKELPREVIEEYNMLQKFIDSGRFKNAQDLRQYETLRFFLNRKNFESKVKQPWQKTAKYFDGGESQADIDRYFERIKDSSEGDRLPPFEFASLFLEFAGIKNPHRNVDGPPIKHVRDIKDDVSLVTSLCNKTGMVYFGCNLFFFF